jgi:hypothetical protein
MKFEDFNYSMYNPYVLVEETDDNQEDIAEKSTLTVKNLDSKFLLKYKHESIVKHSDDEAEETNRVKPIENKPVEVTLNPSQTPTVPDSPSIRRQNSC